MLPLRRAAPVNPSLDLMPAPPSEHHFVLEAADSAALHEAVSRRLASTGGLFRLLWPLHILFWAFCGLAVGATSWAAESQSLSSGHVYTVAVLFSLAILARLSAEKVSRVAVRRSSVRGATLEVRLGVEADRIVFAYADLTVQVPWSSIEHLSEDDRNLYLFVDRTNALPVSRRIGEHALADIRSRVERRTGA